MLLFCLAPFAGEYALAQDATVSDLNKCIPLAQTVIYQLNTDKFGEAEAALAAALANGSEPACVARIFTNMAAALSSSGGFADAERLAERAVRILDSTPAPEGRVLLRSLQILAAARFELGKTGKSREALNRMSTFPMERPEDRAVAHGMHGILLQAEGKSRDAELEYLAGLQAWESAEGDSANTASALSCLASLYLKEGRLDEAHRALERAVAIFSRAKDTASLDHINVLHLRSALRYRRGEWREAEEDLRDAVAMADRQLLLGPVTYAALLADYAQVLRKNRRGREARAIQARAAALGPRQSSTLVDVTELFRERTAPKK